MSDRTQFQLTVYACPPEGVRTVLEVLEEHGLSNDWGQLPAAHDMLYLNRTYTDDQMSVGRSDDLASVLIEAGATFECWEDPAYEYLGTYNANVPGVGSVNGESDADGNIVMKDYDIIALVRDADDLDALKAKVNELLATPVQDAIAVFRDALQIDPTNGVVEIELAPLPEEETV